MGNPAVIWGPGNTAIVLPTNGLVDSTGAAIGGSGAIIMGAGNGATVLTGTTTPVDFTETLDADGLWNGTIFTAAEAGNYMITGSVFLGSSSGNTYNAYVEGSKGIGLSTDANVSLKRLNGVVTLAATDTLEVRSNLGVTLSATTEHHWIAIYKL
jgi:hypothetical protein